MSKVLITLSKLNTLAEQVKRLAKSSFGKTLDEMIDDITEVAEVVSNPCFSTFGFFNCTSDIEVTIPKCSDSLANAFNTNRNANFKNVTVHCNHSIKNMNAAFYFCTQLRTITLDFDTSQCTDFTSAFNVQIANNNLKTIDGMPLDLSSATNVSSMFNQCTKLESVRFAEDSIMQSISFSHSSKLTADSIASIFNGLGTVASTRTLTLHADNQYTLAQKQAANAKGWTITGGTQNG